MERVSQSHGVDQDQGPTKFDMLTDSVKTSMVLLNNSLQEVFGLKDELLKHSLPPKLLVQLTLVSARVFRSYSDLCTPVRELTRLVAEYSTPWEQKSKVLQALRQDYESMQRQLGIALKKIEMMAAEEERIKHERRLMNWEKLYARIMGAKSHGRRWKFRIEPFKRKLKEGFNPYLSDSSDEESSEEDNKRPPTPLEGSDDELKDLGSCSEIEDSEVSPHSGLRTSSSRKRMGYAEMGLQDVVLSQGATPTPALPPVETCDATTWTEESQYDDYLMVRVFRPSQIMPGEDLCCTLSLGDQFYSSQVFPSKPDPLMQEDFHFLLSEDAARTLPPHPQEPLSSIDVPKLNMAVYPGSTAGEMAALVSIPLRELTLTDTPTVLVPPLTSEEQFELDWAAIAAEVQGMPAEYTLNPTFETTDTALIPLVCHRVKVQRHPVIHSGTSTLGWDDLLSELGYRQLVESQSRAVSAIQFDEEVTPQPQEEEKSDHISEEEMAEMTLKHAEEMRKLQDQYERRLEALSRSLTKLKADQAKEIEQLEQALIEAEQNKGKRVRSPSEIRSMLARKMGRRGKVAHGLPEWGKDLPQDFFERLELFAEDSVRRQSELTERIKREVSEVCERQLASQHKLAPGLRTDIDTTTEDVTLPALFMPTPTYKNLVYTPRAHSYFHPPGSTDPRITQPPSVFKLPALNKSHLPTLNLFELSQHFSQTGPQWLKEHHHHSPRYTPAPPPSACGFYF